MPPEFMRDIRHMMKKSPVAVSMMKRDLAVALMTKNLAEAAVSRTAKKRKLRREVVRAM